MAKGLKWYKSAKKRDSYWIEKAKNQFAYRVERLMEYRGMKKKDLAAKLEQSPSNITKVLKGDTNVTIETMVRLVRALDGKLDIDIQLDGAPDRPWLMGVENSKPVAESRARYQEIWRSHAAANQEAHRVVASR